MRNLLLTMMIFLCLAAAVNVTGAYRLSQATDPADGDKDLAKVGERWAKLWSEKQLDQLIELYAADAVFLTGQGARVTGRETIRALFKTALDSNNATLKVRSIVTEHSGNLAYDSGDYTETLTPISGGATREGKGQYVIVFKRQPNGKWLIIEHVWTDAPAGS
jgi:uncharacterized protein (TIGR02246 family)